MATLNLGKISTIIAQELGGEFDSTLWFNQPLSGVRVGSGVRLSNYIGDIYYGSSQMSSAIQIDTNVNYDGLSQEQINNLDFKIGEFTGCSVGFTFPGDHVVISQSTALRFYDFSTNENVAQQIITLFKQAYGLDEGRKSKEFTVNGAHIQTRDFSFISVSD